MNLYRLRVFKKLPGRVWRVISAATTVRIDNSISRDIFFARSELACGSPPFVFTVTGALMLMVCVGAALALATSGRRIAGASPT